MNSITECAPLSPRIPDNQDNLVSAIVRTLTNFREEHQLRLQHSFNLFAELLTQVNHPLQGTPFSQINLYLALNGGFAMCRHAWERNCMDLERVYYLSKLRSLLRIDIVAKIDPNQLNSQEAKDMYFFLNEFSPMLTREDVKPEKVHELSEFMETEHENLKKELPLPLFLKTLQAISLFTPATAAYLSYKPLTCAATIDYWVKKMPANEAFPSYQDFEDIIRYTQGLDFTRAMREERFDEKRWKGFSALNKLTEKQLLMWHSNGKHINHTYRSILRRMKRGKRRMIHVCAMDTNKQIEKEERKAKTLIDKIIIIVEKIFVWLTGYVFHHPNFLTYLPEHSTHAVHGKDRGHGVYQTRIKGEPKSYIREYEININPWLPENVNVDQFERTYMNRLEEIIRQENRHLKPPSNWTKIRRVVFPNFIATVPSEINLSNPAPRTVTCNQFVGEALVEAHVRTCRELNLQVPAAIEFYGFRKGENLGCMTPAGLMNVLIRQGVLRECYNPLNNAILVNNNLE
jgi:hypothetical protein